MTSEQPKKGRLNTNLTQVEAARKLRVSQPYLSQLEKGKRPVTPDLARAAATLYGLSATALPMSELARTAPADPAELARQLSGLGYPGFRHLRAANANPAEVMLHALLQKDLEVRLSEALPWLAVKYGADLNWPWLLRHLKQHDAQNRLRVCSRAWAPARGAQSGGSTCQRTVV
jgi:transcriptional regulator with XRE-family HTH domain